MTVHSGRYLSTIIFMGELFDSLVPELRSRFSGRGLTIENGPPRRAIVPAAHKSVGDLLIYDDDKEITVVYGRFTHCHYGEYLFSATTPALEIVELILSDLEALFSDRLIMWGAHESGGGIYHPGEEARSLRDESDKRYVWSGPL